MCGESMASKLKQSWRRFFPRGYLPELKELVKIAIPLILTQLTQFTVPLVAVMFCGRLGKYELDAVSLANSMINVTGIIIANGLTTACDTLFSQIYGSANRHKLGVALQRSLILITLCVLPCWAIQLNANTLLVAIGQDETVARLAAEYLKIFIPGLLAFFIYSPLVKYVQNQNIIIPNLIIGLIANLINALLHYVFVYVYDYGLHGSAISQVCAYVSFLILTLLYILASKIYKETWSGWSLECFQHWGQFYLLGTYGLLMFCVEWFSFEAGLFMSGVLGTTELGAQAVVFQVETLKFMVPMGLGIAASIRVGQFLGAGDPQGAIAVCGVSLTLTWMLYIVIAVPMGCLRNYIPLMFTNDEDVVTMASNIIPFLIIMNIFDDSVGVSAGLLRGAGKQNLGAAIICVLYVLAVSLSYVLMFYTKLRVIGFWVAMACAVCVETILFIIVLVRSDWYKLSHQAIERAGAAEKDEMSQDERQKLLPDAEASSYRVHAHNVFIIIGFVGVFIAGILCYVLLPQTDSSFDSGNVTNSTMAYSTIADVDL